MYFNRKKKKKKKAPTIQHPHETVRLHAYSFLCMVVFLKAPLRFPSIALSI